MIYREEAYQIIGACMEVHKELGCGFLEAVYQEALEKEFLIRSIPYQKEVILEIFYKGQLLQKSYKADFICFSNIILELKALSELTNQHEAQLLNYLKATQKPLGLLVNFGNTRFVYKRFVM